MNGDQLLELVEGLQSNELLSYDYLLTGYIGKKYLVLNNFYFNRSTSF
jgi:pyridoxal/pyridoxine/pyridoxamine kinase